MFDIDLNFIVCVFSTEKYPLKPTWLLFYIVFLLNQFLSLKLTYLRTLNINIKHLTVWSYTTKLSFIFMINVGAIDDALIRGDDDLTV